MEDVVQRTPTFPAGKCAAGRGAEVREVQHRAPGSDVLQMLPVQCTSTVSAVIVITLTMSFRPNHHRHNINYGSKPKPSPLLSMRQHLNYADCLEDKRKDYQNCSVLYCVTQLCTIMCTLI